MTIQFAKRTENMQASEIREILKLTQLPNVISFAGGLPAAELFPVDEMIQVGTEVLEKEGWRALQYSTTEGDPELRQTIAERMNTILGTTVDSDSVLITSGSQQGLDICGKLLLDAGDIVLCECPTYLGAIQAFRSFSPRFVEVDTDDDGMNLDHLERCIQEHDRVRLIYVVPDFQNPTGRCWSADRRQGLLELAHRHQIPVVEDNPYGELRFRGTAQPSLASLDDNGLVIHLGTFSKTFCPGLRIGWLVADRQIRDRCVLIKQGTDLHTSTLSQRHIATYLRRYDFNLAVERIREFYRQRCNVMLETMDNTFPPGVNYTRPDGGLFLWVELPEQLSARKLLKQCVEQQVAFVPGGSFFPNGGHENTLRLNYSAMPPDRIEEGIQRMAKIIRGMLEQLDSSPASVRATV